jgi:hypothetical protein
LTCGSVELGLVAVMSQSDIPRCPVMQHLYPFPLDIFIGLIELIAKVLRDIIINLLVFGVMACGIYDKASAFILFPM